MTDLNKKQLNESIIKEVERFCEYNNHDYKISDSDNCCYLTIYNEDNEEEYIVNIHNP